MFVHDGFNFRIAFQQRIESWFQHADMPFRNTEHADAAAYGQASEHGVVTSEIDFEMWPPVGDFLVEGKVDGDGLMNISPDEAVDDEFCVPVVKTDSHTRAVGDDGENACLAHAACFSQITVQFRFCKGDRLAISIAELGREVTGSASVGIACYGAHILRCPHADDGGDEHNGEGQENQGGQDAPEIETLPDFQQEIPGVFLLILACIFLAFRRKE